MLHISRKEKEKRIQFKQYISEHNCKCVNVHVEY
jgi:hypothetical protein